MENVVIIGGGFAGSAASYFLAKAGLQPLLLEAKEEVGGGSRGLKVLDEEVPLGARALRLRNSTESIVLQTLAELLPEEYSKALILEEEKGLVYWKGRLIPSPIQSGFANLPFPQRIPYLLSYLFRSKDKPINFVEWAESQWGRQLAEPVINLSRKSWATDPTFMDLKANEKIRETVRSSPIVLSALLGFEVPGIAGKAFNESLSPINSTDIVKAFTKDVQVKTNSKVKREGIRFNIDGSGGVLETEQGEEIGFKYLVSTVPLAAFHHLLNANHRYAKINYHFECLNYNHLVITAIPVPWESLPQPFRQGNKTRMIYFPGSEIFQRMSFASTFTKLKDPNFEILIFEVSVSRSFRNPRNAYFWEYVFNQCMDELETNGFLECSMPMKDRPSHPRSQTVITPGYLLFDRHYEEALNGIEEWCIEKPLTFFGRYGAWNNWEIDHAICQAKDLADYVQRRLE